MGKLKYSYWFRKALILFLAAGLLASCAAPTVLEPFTSIADTPLPVAPISTAQATATTAPSATPPPTLTPSNTPQPEPTATQNPHPMSIIGLRQVDYPGSEITIERELERGSNYSRYYASYLSQGLRIYALLTVPDGEMPPGGWPAIVFNHGYIPPDVYRTTERYIAYVDNLARSGYIVFRIDYRGHDRSEGQATGAYGDPGYTHDVLNAVTALKQFRWSIPKRIGMWGHSMGGYLTLRAMVISPDVQAGVIWGGVVASYPDLLDHLAASGHQRWPNPSRRVPAGARTGWTLLRHPRKTPASGAVSSNSYLSDISGPVQLHHGTADESVPLIFSELLYAASCRQPAKRSSCTLTPATTTTSPTTSSAAMARTIEFFNTYLKDWDSQALSSRFASAACQIIP
jgi:uncharacterized protein